MWRTMLLFTALGILTLNGFVAADPTKPDPKPKPEVKVEEKASVEVYRLKIVEPNDALEAFNALVGARALPRGFHPNPDDPTQPGAGGIGGGGRGNRGAGGIGGGRANGGGGIGGGVQGNRGGTFVPGGSAGTVESDTAPGVTCRGLADLRTRSLVVRGPAKDQQLAADLVAILNTPEGKALPAVKGVHAFRLENIDATDLVAIMQLLDPNMGYRLAAIPRMKLIMGVGTDDQMKELADAVKKLDVPAASK